MGLLTRVYVLLYMREKRLKQNCKRKKIIKKEKDVLSEMQEKCKKGKGKRKMERTKDAHVLLLLLFELVLSEIMSWQGSLQVFIHKGGESITLTWCSVGGIFSAWI